VCFQQVIYHRLSHIFIRAHVVIELVVGPAQPLILISWHNLHGAFCIFRNKIIGAILGHHLGLRLFILDHFLM
jgi:hypothetical protein